jgi:hypothetical protein
VSVFVLDKPKKPLMPCSEKRARLLLERGRARIARRFPFTIRPVDRRLTESVVQPIRVKIDPGSKTTRFSVVRDEDGNKASSVLFLVQLQHRGAQIRKAIQHRVDTVSSWVARLRRLVPVTGIATELVRFDMQLLDDPDISGTGYQQGTLAGYELREFLLNKWGRACAYCGADHALDAACVGETNALSGWNKPSLVINAMGRGSYFRTRLDKYGGNY